ncbi:5-oxoprolinase subunit PxpB [Bacillus sp. FJAT-45350]|uniref:5-oxoprolinase subunit PxpB n=1 Tax=Bacillus sp. FJAT-45350 TaxID=2011014 RepID=UPI000BB7116F|nr:5-oxoprolinase subunit PxpB [Bacillus sp. FJAT-45350]
MNIVNKYKCLGDCALRIEFGTMICKEVNKKIRRFCFLLEQENNNGIIEWVPAYTTVTVFYNPSVITYNELIEYIESLEGVRVENQIPKATNYLIPTCYDKEFGYDLETVAKFHSIDKDTIVRLHSQPSYLVYMLGFSPGFPYLGGMSERIATPRLKVPRERVEAGSVGIAGSQTGIYSLDTPGGWRIIGKTPVKLFDSNRNRPVLFQAGDYVTFVPISVQQYYDIQKEVENGTYQIKEYSMEE